MMGICCQDMRFENLKCVKMRLRPTALPRPPSCPDIRYLVCGGRLSKFKRFCAKNRLSSPNKVDLPGFLAKSSSVCAYGQLNSRAIDWLGWCDFRVDGCLLALRGMDAPDQKHHQGSIVEAIDNQCASADQIHVLVADLRALRAGGRNTHRIDPH